MTRRKRSDPGSAPRTRGLPDAARPERRSSGQRPIQVGEAVRQALAEMLVDGSVKDPRLGTALLTITDVEMTPDLRLARIFFSVFPDDDDTLRAILKGLKSAAREMKRGVGARVGLRFTPTLEFRLDPSVAQGARIETLLREIRDEESVTPGAEPTEDPDAEHGAAE